MKDSKTIRKAQWYLWYLVETPFNDSTSNYYFDHDHWWKRSPKTITHDAALFELLRRHPRVGNHQREIVQFRLGNREQASIILPSSTKEIKLKGSSSMVVEFKNDEIQYFAGEMLLYGLKSWPKLSDESRTRFQESLRNVYPGKGRDLTKGVFDVTELAKEAERSERDVGGPSFEEVLMDITKAFADQGRVFLAFDADFDSKKDAKLAVKRMQEMFWKHWKKPHRQTRSHEVDWLTAIEEFEEEFYREGYGSFKLGYPKKFKNLISHFDNGQYRNIREWWRKNG